MPEARAEDMRDPIPTDDEELRELKEDLRAMGCAGLLARPWNVQSDDLLREFRFERGNQWDGTKRRDPKHWTPDTWARVYGFQSGIEEGWAGRKDGLFLREFKGEVHPKEGLHPANCLNPRERRMLEFIMPILNPDKPKRITLTMANILFGALFGVRPVNWGMLIHEVVSQAIPYICRKPSYLSPFIMHLYAHYGCTTVEEDDMLTIAAEEVAYKLQPVVPDTSTSNDHAIPEAPPSSPENPPQSFRMPNSPPTPSLRHRLQSPEAAGPIRTQADAPWRNVDLSTWEFPENPFQRLYDDLADLQTQYYRLEHFTRGANAALNDCGPGNILRELAKRADRKELDHAKRELE